jgi:hypothetical protein
MGLWAFSRALSIVSAAGWEPTPCPRLSRRSASPVASARKWGHTMQPLMCCSLLASKTALFIGAIVTIDISLTGGRKQLTGGRKQKHGWEEARVVTCTLIGSEWRSPPAGRASPSPAWPAACCAAQARWCTRASSRTAVRRAPAQVPKPATCGLGCVAGDGRVHRGVLRCVQPHPCMALQLGASRGSDGEREKKASSILL